MSLLKTFASQQNRIHPTVKSPEGPVFVPSLSRGAFLFGEARFNKLTHHAMCRTTMPTKRAHTILLILAVVALLSSISILVSWDVVRDLQDGKVEPSLLHALIFQGSRSSDCRPRNAGGDSGTATKLCSGVEPSLVFHAGYESPIGSLRSRREKPERYFRKPVRSKVSDFDSDAPTILVQLAGTVVTHLRIIGERLWTGLMARAVIRFERH
jgi:hypothetical protein